MPSHYEEEQNPVKATDVERLLDQTGPEYTRQTIANVKPPPPKEESPWWHGVALETSVGIAADFLTAPLLAAPIPGARPLYYGINYGVGYGTNVVAQRLRGETEINQGEAHAAGGFQTIPMGTTLKGVKGLRRAMYKGAGAGLVGRQVEVGIDEGRVLTPGEAISSAGVGAAFGGTLKGIQERKVLKQQLKNQIFKTMSDTATPVYASDKFRDKQRKAYWERTGKKVDPNTQYFEPETDLILPEKSNKPKRPFKSTPQRQWEAIYNNKVKYPTLEHLEAATVGPGYEVKGWTYVRPSGAGGTSQEKWEQITKRLQKRFGGTEDQRQAFIATQKAAWKQTQNDIRQLNDRFQFNYLEFSKLGLEQLTENKVIDLTQADDTLFKIYLEMASNPKKYPIFELGHIRSAKNIARETPKDIFTSADYASNLRAEIRRSIRDFTKYNPKTKKYKVIESGNQRRKAHMDAPKVINMLLGTSPNVEVEYLRFIGDFGYALENIIPFEKHDHFMKFMRDGISKWQKSAKGGLVGKQQLDQYPKIKNKLINDYLNMMDEGAFLDDAAKSDFIDHALIDRRSGLEAQRAGEAESLTVFSKNMPRFRGDERGAK